MKIKIINANEIVATIPAAEIIARGLKMADFKQGSEVATSLINEIMDEAQNEGFHTEDTFLSIAIDMTAAGLSLHLQKVDRERVEKDLLELAEEDEEDAEEEVLEEKTEITAQKKTILQFNSLRKLLNFVSILDNSNNLGIYEDRNNKEFYLVMNAVESNPRCKAFVMEYCTERVEKVSEDYVKEHYTLFLHGDSVNKLKEVLR